MKKALSLVAAAALAMTCTALPVNAEDAVKANVPDAVYDQLLDGYNKYTFDQDSDGVVTQEELETSYQLELDLTGIEDLSFLKDLKACRTLELSNGSITDISAVKEMPSLANLRLTALPLEDLSSIKGVTLYSMDIEQMNQISLEEKLDLVTWTEAKIDKGFSVMLEPTPRGLFYDEGFWLKIDDTSIAEKTDRFTSAENFEIYGNQPGTTAYHIFKGEDEVLSGEITVSPFEVKSEPLDDTADTSEVVPCLWYGEQVAVLEEGALYGIKDHLALKYSDNAADLGYFYEKNAEGDYFYYDMLLENDGTLFINNVKVEGLTFDHLTYHGAVTADNEFYKFYEVGGSETPVLICSDYADHPYNSDHYYISTSGELVWYTVDYTSSGKALPSTVATGIKSPVSCEYDLFVDKDGVLWKCSSYRGFSKTKVASGVVECGYYTLYDGGTTYGYKLEDGTYHQVSSGKEINVVETPVYVNDKFINDGVFYIHQLSQKYTNGQDSLIRWFIDNDHVLTVDFVGQHFAIDGVDKAIAGTYSEITDKSYVWFIRSDGSIWSYCIDDQTLKKHHSAGTAPVKFDVNGDGEFNISDAVVLQKWLLGDGTELANGAAADADGDGRTSVFDLILMKQALVD